MQRVVTLIASATEIVAALGAADRIVGRSHECDYPPAVLGLPALTAPKFALDGTSYEIDSRVKALVAEGSAVYRVDADHLKALAPDLIVTQDQCEVCAASLGDVERALRDWQGAPVEIVSLKPDCLADVWRDIARVAAALGDAPAGDALAAGLQQRMAAVERAVAGRPQPRVACIEWVDPLMAAGNWMPELVAMAGGENLLGVAGRHSPWMTFTELAACEPDVVVVLPCGYDMARTIQDMPLLEAQDGWRALPAVRTGRVAIVDGNQYFNRPGPRLADSLEILADILHGIDSGHRGTGWAWHR